jgi:hypothetical protein
MLSGMRMRPWVLDLLPAVVLVAVILSDVLVGSGNVVLGLVVIAPLLAANLCSARLTAVYAVAALVAAVLLGVYNHQYAEGPRTAQLIRICGVTLAGILAVTTAHYRLVREERLAQVTRVAEVVQRAVLPPVPPRIDAVDLAVHYESAAREASVGGDFYAAVATLWGVRLIVGDVRGKGLDAVRLAAEVLAAFRERAPDRADLEEVLDDLDRAARREAGEEDFVTALVAQIEPDGGLVVASAGHPPPFVVEQSGVSLLPLSAVRPPLGLPGSGQVERFTLTPAQRLLLYTDGLVEARRPRDGTFFPPNLVGARLGQGTLAEGLEALRSELVAWSGGQLQDDVALVVAQWGLTSPVRAVPAVDLRARI